MAKNTPTVSYKCKQCETVRSAWFGKCPACGAFSTAEEVAASGSSSDYSSAGLKSSGPQKPGGRASTISELNSRPIKRTKTGISELDRVLGGGFVEGEVVLFAGQPGAGKSSLSLHIADKFAGLGKKVLYASGEESENQIGLRAARFGVDNDNIRIVNESSLEVLLGHMEEVKPDFVIVDSLQTLASSEITGSTGSLAQSKECAHTLTRIAKKQNVMMLLISQVVKNGEFAGSEAIQHIVDATLMLESDNETPLKFLRATKNRFGDTTEVGVFQHEEKGLMEVSDPSGIFMEEESNKVSGATCSFISEGVRQLPVEIQALVTRSTLPQPRKQFNGVQFNRAQIVCAIMDKFCNARLYENDVFVATVSGIKVNDPQADLSIAASILSSLHNKVPHERTAFVGELSLTGQVRGTFLIENKLREAVRLGFDRIVIPQGSLKGLKSQNYPIKIVGIKSAKELLPLL